SRHCSFWRWRMRSFALWALLVFGCGDGGSAITIGGLLSQTGTLSTIGQEQIRAAQMAVDEINAGGGVLGTPPVLFNRDDGSDKTRTPMVAMDLITNQKPPVIVGSIGSGNTVAASDVTIPAGVILFSGSSTSPAITTLADNDTVFRTCPSDALQGQLLAK